MTKKEAFTKVAEFILENRDIKHQHSREYLYDLMRVRIDKDRTVGNIYPLGSKN